MPGPAHRQPLTGGARIPHQRRDLLLRPWLDDADGLAADDMAKILSDAIQGSRLRHHHPGPPIPTSRPSPAQLLVGASQRCQQYAARASANTLWMR